LAQTVTVGHGLLPQSGGLSVLENGTARLIILPAIIGIGIIDPQTRQYLGFKALHLKGFGVRQVIIS
jgi:hypothetical protein